MRTITVGFACNNACAFCAQGEARHDRPAASEVEIARALDEIAPGEAVALLGGEPTIFADLPSWIRAADARGAAHIVVQTNGRRLAYRAFTHTLREASSRLSLDVSLHGSTPAMHDWHTATPGSFAQTVQGLRNARAEGIPTGITTVVTRSNFRHLAEIVRIAHAASAAAIHFASVAPFGSARRAGTRVVPALEMVAPYLQRAESEAERLGLPVQLTEGDRWPPSLLRGPPSNPARVLFVGLGEVDSPVPVTEEVVVGRHR
jgi:MoaA/NifB/PqqE/SkfB family radical SAM enzyme